MSHSSMLKARRQHQKGKKILDLEVKQARIEFEEIITRKWNNSDGKE